MSVRQMLGRPSGYVPLLLCLAAAATIVIQLITHGAAPSPDEGAAAHFFQLLMVVDVACIGFFALARLPRDPRAGVWVLALQVGAMAACWAPVFILHW